MRRTVGRFGELLAELDRDESGSVMEIVLIAGAIIVPLALVIFFFGQRILNDFNEIVRRFLERDPINPQPF